MPTHGDGCEHAAGRAWWDSAVRPSRHGMLASCCWNASALPQGGGRAGANSDFAASNAKKGNRGAVRQREMYKLHSRSVRAVSRRQVPLVALGHCSADTDAARKADDTEQPAAVETSAVNSSRGAQCASGIPAFIPSPPSCPRSIRGRPLVICIL